MDIHCPDCRARVPGFPRACPACGLLLIGPVAQELWFVDLEIGRLNGHRQVLIDRLRALSASATARPGASAAAASEASAAVPSEASAAVPSGASAAVASATSAAVHPVLLALGGALLGIAAIVFTVISWGELSLGARALVLLSLTAVALGAVWPLARRTLRATAETVALVGLVLIALECYAAYTVDLFGLGAVDGRWYTVGAVVAGTLLWAGYGRMAPLRLPRPTAIVLAQLPLPLAAYAAEASPAVLALALLVVSAADLAVRRAASGAERMVATVTGLATGLAGTLTALGFSFGADQAVAYAGALAVAAAVAFAWALHLDRVIAVASGLAAAVALATPLPLPQRWSAAGYAGAAVSVLAAVRLLSSGPLAARLRPGRLLPARLLPARPRQGRLRGPSSLGAVLVLGGAVPWIVPAAAIAALRPVGQLAGIWSGVPTSLPAAAAAWIVPAAPVVLALSAVVLAVSRWRTAAPVPAALTAMTLPAVLNLPYAWSLVLLVTTVGALGGWAALDRAVRVSAGVAAVLVAVPAVLASLVTKPATLAVLGALTLLSTGFAALVRPLRTGAMAVAVLSLGGFAAALGLASGLPAHWAASGVLAGAALGLAAASWVRSVPAETACWVVAAVAVAMSAERQAPELFSLALALTGVLAFGVSLRTDRRRAAWAGSVLLLAAFWVRLGTAGVTVPEAYAAPPAAGALLVGVLRRRRDRAVSSWAAYGPGLACILVPSLLAVWAETGRLRAVLLAVAAAAVTVIGARARLQAPLLLGATVLLLDAVHELAPAVARVTVRLPGWFPIAAIGLAVLLLGATYEQRLRDLRRLREAVTRLD